MKTDWGTENKQVVAQMEGHADDRRNRYKGLGGINIESHDIFIMGM